MNDKSDTMYNICHDAIHTQAVFFDNNQVYLRRNIGIDSQNVTESAEWSPINFRWIPILLTN